MKLGDVGTIGIVTAGFHILRTKQLATEIPELAEKKLLYYPAEPDEPGGDDLLRRPGVRAGHAAARKAVNEIRHLASCGQGAFSLVG